MQQQMFDLAQDYIWRSARLIDRHLFAYLFCESPQQPVITALVAYQNPDGGFGNALEPDKRTPASQPIDAEEALHYLDAVDALTSPQVHQTILRPLCDWLQTITRPEGGVPFILPSANPYPHTPWMGASSDNPPAALNPTAAIAGLLLKGGVHHPWLDRAVDFCWQGIAALQDSEFHNILPAVTFLLNAPALSGDQGRAAHLLAGIIARVGQPGVVELDPHAGGYVHPPLDWAARPDSPFRPLFSDSVIHTHLAALAAAQRPDGGWPISWDTLSPAVEAEWRAKATLGALEKLRAYNFE